MLLGLGRIRSNEAVSNEKTCSTKIRLILILDSSVLEFPQRINFASAGATALGLYSILKQCLDERVFALLFAEYSKKQWHITLI
jgi:hypothetical protein